jgi:hypothetical protein
LIEKSEELKVLTSQINEKKYKPTELGLTTRVANLWDQNQLFFEENKSRQWNRFDLVESVWIKLVIELKKFNVQSQIIKTVKSNFINQPFKDENLLKKALEQINMNKSGDQIVAEVSNELKKDHVKNYLKSFQTNILELIIRDTIAYRNEYIILILPSGEVIPNQSTHDNESQVNEAINFYKTQTYISISINSLLSELMVNLSTLEFQTKLKIITEEEQKVLDVLRLENITKVEITYLQNSKNINTIEFTTETPIEKQCRLSDIILTGGYQNISIKTQAGEIVHCSNKTKLKL